MNKRLIAVAIGSILNAQKADGDTGGNSPSPDTLGKIPKDVANKASAKHSPEAQGTARASMILTAEQGIRVAGENLAKTRMDGLIEVAKYSDPKDAVKYIGAVQVQFVLLDGDTLTKAHNNFLSDLRRVKFAVHGETSEGAGGMEQTLKTLQGPGTYPDKMEALPKRQPAKGSNKGTGAKADEQDLKDAKGGDETAAGRLATTLGISKPSDEAAKVSMTDLIRHIIPNLPQNQIEAVCLALAQRCKTSGATGGDNAWHAEIAAAIEQVFAKHDAMNPPQEETETGTTVPGTPAESAPQEQQKAA